MSSNEIRLGVNQKHIYSQADETRCPSCYQNTLIKIGELSFQGGLRQDAHKCTSCNQLTSTTDGGIRSLVTEGMNLMGGPVSFISSSSGVISGSGGSGTIANTSYAGGNYGYANNSLATQASITLDYNTNSKFDSMNSNLSNISGTMYQLITEMQTLSRTVKDLAQQNKDLMEKLATDPMNGIRKAVNNFNLE